jgi:hypothetical protein
VKYISETDAPYGPGIEHMLKLFWEFNRSTPHVHAGKSGGGMRIFGVKFDEIEET